MLLFGVLMSKSRGQDALSETITFPVDVLLISLVVTLSKCFIYIYVMSLLLLVFTYTNKDDLW